MSSRPVQPYCLPYAGSSASVYVRWKRRLPSWIAAWRDQTRADFSMLPGGHFFIHEQESALFALLEQHLRRAIITPHVTEAPRSTRFGGEADAGNGGP